MSCFRQPQFILQDLHPGKSSFSWKPVNKKFYCKALAVAFHISSRKSSANRFKPFAKGCLRCEDISIPYRLCQCRYPGSLKQRVKIEIFSVFIRLVSRPSVTRQKHFHYRKVLILAHKYRLTILRTLEK